VKYCEKKAQEEVEFARRCARQESQKSKAETDAYIQSAVQQPRSGKGVLWSAGQR